MIVETKPCLFCGKTGLLDLPQDGVKAYAGGFLVQEAFPTVPAPLREQFVSGVHPACWQEMFGADE